MPEMPQEGGQRWSKEGKGEQVRRKEEERQERKGEEGQQWEGERWKECDDDCGQWR